MLGVNITNATVNAHDMATPMKMRIAILKILAMCSLGLITSDSDGHAQYMIISFALQAIGGNSGFWT